MNLSGAIVGGIFAFIFLLICIYSGYKAIKDRKRIIAKNARIRAERLKEQLEEEEEAVKKQNEEQKLQDPGHVHDIVQCTGVEFSNEGKVPNGKTRSALSDPSHASVDKNGPNMSVTTVTIETNRTGSRSNLLDHADGKESSENDSGISNGDSKRRSSKFRKRKSGSAVDEKSPEYEGRVNPSLTPEETTDVAMEMQLVSALSGVEDDVHVSREAQTNITAVKRPLHLRNRCGETSSVATSTNTDVSDKYVSENVGHIRPKPFSTGINGADNNVRSVTNQNNEDTAVVTSDHHTKMNCQHDDVTDRHLDDEVITHYSSGDTSGTQKNHPRVNREGSGGNIWGNNNKSIINDYENGNIHNEESSTSHVRTHTTNWVVQKQNDDLDLIGNGVSMETPGKSTSIEEIVVNI